MQMLIVCFLSFASLVIVTNGARQAIPMKSYRIDLNDPPETRWNHILQPYLPSIPLVVDYFDSLVSKLFGISYNSLSRYYLFV